MIRYGSTPVLTVKVQIAYQNKKEQTMFTIDQIKETHSKVKSGADFPKYIQDMKLLGIIAYDMYVSDGHAQYFGAGSFTIISDPEYAVLAVAGKSSKENLEHALRIHQHGQTDYPAFCRQAADSGVEKWTVNTEEMSCTYYDKQGNTLVVEHIPAPRSATSMHLSGKSSDLILSRKIGAS